LLLLLHGLARTQPKALVMGPLLLLLELLLHLLHALLLELSKHRHLLLLLLHLHGLLLLLLLLLDGDHAPTCCIGTPSSRRQGRRCCHL
jgi:hypothetical protein